MKITQLIKSLMSLSSWNHSQLTKISFTMKVKRYDIAIRRDNPILIFWILPIIKFLLHYASMLLGDSLRRSTKMRNYYEMYFILGTCKSINTSYYHD